MKFERENLSIDGLIGPQERFTTMSQFLSHMFE